MILTLLPEKKLVRDKGFGHFFDNISSSNLYRIIKLLKYYIVMRTGMVTKDFSSYPMLQHVGQT